MGPFTFLSTSACHIFFAYSNKRLKAIGTFFLSLSHTNHLLDSTACHNQIEIKDHTYEDCWALAALSNKQIQLFIFPLCSNTYIDWSYAFFTAKWNTFFKSYGIKTTHGILRHMTKYTTKIVIDLNRIYMSTFQPLEGV